MDDVNIKEITEIFFSVDAGLYINDPKKLLKIGFYHKMGLNTDAKRVKFTLSAYVHYQDNTAKLAEIAVNNFFELPLMNQYKTKGNDLMLPGKVLKEIVRESIAHVRALFFIRLSATPYQQIIIPLDDATKITLRLFPTLIQYETGDMSDFIGKVEQ